MNGNSQDLPFGQNIDLSLFAAVVNGTSNGVVITDHLAPDEPIIYCNPAFVALTGYTEEEILGKNCRLLQGDDREQPARFELQKAIQEGRNCVVELRNYDKNGKLFWNELVVSPVVNAQGIITHFIAVQNDITKRKATEASLQQERDHLEERVQERTNDLELSEAYMQSIVETVRESLVVLDENLNVLGINDHFCRFFGVEDGNVVNKKLFEIGEGQWNIPELKNLLQNVLPHNNPFEGFEIENKFQQIGKKLLVLNARQITLKGKYQNRILLAIEDRTEQREIERRKEDFISIASHEMKTPLTSIKGNIQLMQRKAMRNNDSTYLSSLTTAVKSVERLDKLINELLDVSRIQSGKIQLNISPFYLDELVREAVESIQESTESHQIEIAGNPHVEIWGDFPRLEQVLINLLSNAVKFSPQSKKVTVDVKQSDDSVRVAIIDSGVGISKQDQKRIFDRFYRVDKVQEKFPGVGIGLYISNQVITGHKGKLWVESEEGLGSTFYFTIPLNK